MSPGSKCFAGIALQRRTRRSRSARCRGCRDAASRSRQRSKFAQAQIDPARCGVALDATRRQIDDGVSRGDRRDADARAARERQLSVALAQDRRADADDGAGHGRIRGEVLLHAALHLGGVDRRDRRDLRSSPPPARIRYASASSLESLGGPRWPTAIDGTSPRFCASSGCISADGVLAQDAGAVARLGDRAVDRGQHVAAGRRAEDLEDRPCAPLPPA